MTGTTHHSGRLTARCPGEVVGLRVPVTDWTGVDIDPLKLDVHGGHSHRPVEIHSIVINNTIN